MTEDRARGALGDTFAHAARGIVHTWRHERSFRIQVALGAVGIALAAWLGVGLVVVLAFGALVLVLELLNTALERLADAVHPAHHPLVGAAKDASAAAVLVAAFAALAAALAVLGPPLLARLGGSA